MPYVNFFHGTYVALGMKENLSYHMARHSFGTLTLTAGIPEDGKQAVGKYVEQVAKANGANVTIKGFVRFETGEGIEKKEHIDEVRA